VTKFHAVGFRGSPRTRRWKRGTCPKKMSFCCYWLICHENDCR